MFDHARLMTPAQAQFLRQCALLCAFLLSGGNNIFPRIPLAAALVLLCFILNGLTFGIRREMRALGLVMLATFAVAIIGSQDFINSAIAIRFTNFALGGLLLAMYVGLPKRQFVDDVYPMLWLMAWQAIGTVFLATFFSGLFTQVDVRETVYNTIFWIFTWHSSIEDATALARANGFFFEPGVFQMYLNIFLFLAAFVRKKPRDVALATVGVLATQSTMGLVIAALLLGFYYLDSLRTMSFSTKLFTTALVPVVMIPLLFVVVDNVNEKVTGQFQGSAWARTYDFNTGLAVALNNPLIGIGFDYQRYYDEAQSVGYKETQLDDRTIINRGNSNGVVTVLYSVGIPLALIFYWGLFAQSFFAQRWLFAGLMFMSLMTEALFFSPFVLMFAYSGLLLKPKSVPVAIWRARRLSTA